MRRGHVQFLPLTLSLSFPLIPKGEVSAPPGAGAADSAMTCAAGQCKVQCLIFEVGGAERDFRLTLPNSDLAQEIEKFEER